MHMNQLGIPNPKIGQTSKGPGQTPPAKNVFLKWVWREPLTWPPLDFWSPWMRSCSISDLCFPDLVSWKSQAWLIAGPGQPLGSRKEWS